MGKSCFLFTLLLLLILNLAVHLEKALLASCLSFSCQGSCIVLFFLPAGIILSLPSVAGLFDLLCFFHELSGLLLLARQVSLPLELYLLLMLPLVEFESFSQLGNRHLFHQAMATRFSWVESLSPLDRDLFKLTDLPD